MMVVHPPRGTPTSLIDLPRDDHGSSPTPYHGNRFNILFENAVALFFLHTPITDFLQGHQSNNLLKAVYHDIIIPEYLAGAKALGLISRLITGPLWCLVEDREIHVFDMNNLVMQLLNSIEYASANTQEFIEGKVLPFGEKTKLNKDPMFDFLLKRWEHDDKVKVCLSVLLPALAMCGKKLFKDHLPGGRWEEVGVEMRDKAAGTHKHNKFSESVFGYLDQMLRKSPNVSVLSAEAYLMFVSNKTLPWLQSKNELEQKRLISEAVHEVKTVRREFNERRKEIQRKHLLAMEEASRKSEEAEKRRVATLEKYTSAVIYHGLWQSEEQVETSLETLPTIKEKKEALKAQLNFRQRVLKQEKKLVTDCENVYLFSKKVNGKTTDCSVDELAFKVKALIRQSFTVPITSEPTDVPVLVGRHVSHMFVTGGGGDDVVDTWYKGKVISQDTNRGTTSCTRETKPSTRIGCSTTGGKAV